MKNQPLSLDRTDKRILEKIQNDDRISNLELADSIGLSPTPCARRVKRLEDEGIIRGHATLLDESKLGLKLTALISISMDRHTPERFENFEEQIKRFPEIVECSLVTGQSADYLLKVVIPDMEHYETFLLGHLTKIEGVTGVHSSFVLRKVINHTALPLNYL
ncbi:MAG: Lrp/AsnC family transcriptional regulator [Pseudomonadales bacterium]|nr:Lrp/AsnC family transcriptional regulator [Pseudomonadales bacterium]